MRHTFFFDLDGTLLPMDMDAFTKVYFDGAKKSGMFERISEKRGQEIFGKAVYAMLGNDGSMTNKALFFAELERMAGVKQSALAPYIDAFYTKEFKLLKQCTRTDKRAVQAIKTLQNKGYRLVLATQPLFPPIATNQRIDWAGLKPEDFEYVSYYDNSRYCKPNPNYFAEILSHLKLSADDCYFVGNDVHDDMSAAALGFEGFLVLDHVIGDLEKVPKCEQGDYSDLLKFVENLPQI